MNKDIFIIGAGGHASVLLDSLKKSKQNVRGYIAPEEVNNSPLFDGLRHLQDDSAIELLDAEQVILVNGIGTLPGQTLRARIFARYQGHGFHFLSVVDPSATVSEYAQLQEGAQVLPGAIINAGALIGKNSIINTGAIIEHDCVLGADNHVAPRAVLCGGVITEENVHIGTGATVIQSITLKEGTLIASGAVVNRNTDKNMTVYSPRSVYQQR